LFDHINHVVHSGTSQIQNWMILWTDGIVSQFCLFTSMNINECQWMSIHKFLNQNGQNDFYSIENDKWLLNIIERKTGEGKYEEWQNNKMSEWQNDKINEWEHENMRTWENKGMKEWKNERMKN
jgi:hypothetical protein